MTYQFLEGFFPQILLILFPYLFCNWMRWLITLSYLLSINKFLNRKISRYIPFKKSFRKISGGLCTQIFYSWIREKHLFTYLPDMEKIFWKYFEFCNSKPGRLTRVSSISSFWSNFDINLIQNLSKKVFDHSLVPCSEGLLISSAMYYTMYNIKYFNFVNVSIKQTVLVWH